MAGAGSTPDTVRHPDRERPVTGRGAVRITPVDPERDAPVIHRWVTEERAAFWGMTGTSVEDVRDVYAHMGTLDTHHAHLVHRGDEPVALFQTYDPAEDRVGSCYEVRPGDVGVHLLVAPAAGASERGFTERLVTALLTRLSADPGLRRIVVEPDARNEKAIARLLRTGFEPGPEVVLPAIDLPDVRLPAKRARLAFLRREAFPL
ncbi:GNAT family N-acetyltransferase [Streptomyces sp. TRM43335]|uniref:Lysine N-acyltransferase MbtK n=1 Tax=Streptomyces taklimakanensis TaxID=2569853 RepID=A0A6G2BJ41_9ACTN|nr:GNAT family N-acetyltransferase [Streptomyces taklimakanensis]MTE22301.1 GNAT family N-acetyltransferase [Streptomyces taklimakanensis]